MALNIHEHICYELLRNLSYARYDIVVTILLGIFWIVKLTDMIADYWLTMETKKYENRVYF